uniref:Uncharacterized protein n=1 Tax=viral metagenome TaxID=1070528 RepID=A0A6C0DQC7_9ZZZZ
MSRRTSKCSCGRDKDRYSDDTESVVSDDSSCYRHPREEKPKKECNCSSSGKEDSKCDNCGGKKKKSEKNDKCKCKCVEKSDDCDKPRCYKPDKFIIIKM